MDLSYSDEDGFENYIPTTTDPGPWLFSGTALYSVGCFVMIPILVTIMRKSDKKRNMAQVTRSSEGAKENDDSPPELVDCEDLNFQLNKSTEDDVGCDELGIQLTLLDDIPLHASDSLEQNQMDNLDGWIGKIASETETPSNPMKEFSFAVESEHDTQIMLPSEPIKADILHVSIDEAGSIPLQGGEENVENNEDKENSENIDVPFALKVQSEASEAANLQYSQITNAPEQESERSGSDPQSCCENVCGCTKQKFIASSRDIVRHDKETKRILKLAVPFVMSEVSEVLFEALTVLLVSRYTNVDQLSAYIVTNLLIGTSETLIQGFLETLETVCSHAVGYGNNKLAGQYVQMVATLYSIFSIPIFGIWWFVMGPALKWFGLNAAAVEIGVKYTKILIFDYYIEGIFEAVGAIPDVTGKERVTNIYQVSHEVVEFAVVWVLFAKIEEFDLFWMGVLHLGSAFIGFVGFTAVTVKLGWFDAYWEGLTKSIALKNKSAVKYVIKMALPLSIGALFEYGEWELLTIFAASMGQAELAAWGLMESIWDLLEAFAEGFGNAGEVRVALQLGRGNICQAKRSAWKSLFLVTILGIVITMLYGVIGEYLVYLYTSDETLQGMLKAMVPIVAFGNVFQAFGSMAWALVGGQGRYHHATIVSSTITMTVSIPLAAFFSLAMDFPLESLVAALVIGYSTVSMCLSYLLITSDWKFISDKIIEEMDDGSSSSSYSPDDDSSSSSSDEASDKGDVQLVTNEENRKGIEFSPSSPSSPSSTSSPLENVYCAGDDKSGETVIVVKIHPQHETSDQSSVEVSIRHQYSTSSSSPSSSAIMPSMNDEEQTKENSVSLGPKSDKSELGLSSSYPSISLPSPSSCSPFATGNAKVAAQHLPTMKNAASNKEVVKNDGNSSSHTDAVATESIKPSSADASTDAEDAVIQQNDEINLFSTPLSTPKSEKHHSSSSLSSSSSSSNSSLSTTVTIMQETDHREVFSTQSSSPKSENS